MKCEKVDKTRDLKMSVSIYVALSWAFQNFLIWIILNIGHIITCIVYLDRAGKVDNGYNIIYIT